MRFDFGDLIESGGLVKEEKISPATFFALIN